MSARPDDLLDFYRSDLGRAIPITLSAVSAQNTDAQGPLPPGRYLLLLRAAAGQWAWIRVGPYVVGGTLTAVSGDGFPLSKDSIFAVEFNVRRGHNDRIAAILEAAGAATLYALPLAA